MSALLSAVLNYTLFATVIGVAKKNIIDNLYTVILY